MKYDLEYAFGILNALKTDKVICIWRNKWCVGALIETHIIGHRNERVAFDNARLHNFIWFLLRFADCIWKKCSREKEYEYGIYNKNKINVGKLPNV